MKKSSFFNPQPVHSLQQAVADAYDREARDFQKRYNQKHPCGHIWRHILYQRNFRFFLDGELILVSIEIVRFIDAHSGKTFTFYGTLFLPFSIYSSEFVRAAVSDPYSEQASFVSAECLRTWTHRSGHAHPLQLHNPPHSTSCISVG